MEVKVIKALAILGSPRMEMNTHTLLKSVVKGLLQCNVEVENIYLKKLDIHPCTHCGYCEKKGKCIIEDDMISLYKKFDEADMVIIASPMYFNSVSSITKTMIDRCQMFWSSKYIYNQSSIDRHKKRIGMFICTAGSKHKKEGFLGATMVMDLFFRSINASYDENLLIDGTDKTLVKDQEGLLQKAEKLGRKIGNNLIE